MIYVCAVLKLAKFSNEMNKKIPRPLKIAFASIYTSYVY